MSVIKWIFKGKIFKKTHCEKTSYFLASVLLISVYFTYLLYTNQYQYPISYFYLALGSVVAGYLGVLGYKVTNHKPLKPKTLIFFWLSK